MAAWKQWGITRGVAVPVQDLRDNPLVRRLRPSTGGWLWVLLAAVLTAGLSHSPWHKLLDRLWTTSNFEFVASMMRPLFLTITWLSYLPAAAIVVYLVRRAMDQPIRREVAMTSMPNRHIAAAVLFWPLVALVVIWTVSYVAGAICSYFEFRRELGAALLADIRISQETSFWQHAIRLLYHLTTLIMSSVFLAIAMLGCYTRLRAWKTLWLVAALAAVGTVCHSAFQAVAHLPYNASGAMSTQLMAFSDYDPGRSVRVIQGLLERAEPFVSFAILLFPPWVALWAAGRFDSEWVAPESPNRVTAAKPHPREWFSGDVALWLTALAGSAVLLLLIHRMVPIPAQGNFEPQGRALPILFPIPGAAILFGVICAKIVWWSNQGRKALDDALRANLSPAAAIRPALPLAGMFTAILCALAAADFLLFRNWGFGTLAGLIAAPVLMICVGLWLAVLPRAGWFLLMLAAYVAYDVFAGIRWGAPRSTRIDLDGFVLDQIREAGIVNAAGAFELLLLFLGFTFLLLSPLPLLLRERQEALGVTPAAEDGELEVIDGDAEGQLGAPE